MSTTRAEWIEGVAVAVDDTSPADTEAAVGSIDLAAQGLLSVAFQVEATFQATTGYVDINVYGSVDSGGDVDTAPIANRRWTVTSAAQHRISLVVPYMPWIQIEIQNESNAELLALAVKQAGLKFITE